MCVIVTFIAITIEAQHCYKSKFENNDSMLSWHFRVEQKDLIAIIKHISRARASILRFLRIWKKKHCKTFHLPLAIFFFFSFPFSAFSNSLLNIHKFRMQKLHAGKKVGKIVLLYTRNHVSSSALNVRVRESVYLVRHQTDFESCYHPSEWGAAERKKIM